VSDERPVAALFDEVVGQPAAVATLRAAAASPVHAYLFRGPEGNGGLAAAHGFAAALLCPDGGCGHCVTCRGALAGSHPDVHVIRRSGATLRVDDAQQAVTVASRRPLESDRQVVIMLDLHLAQLTAPVLLKTLEEPPGDTIFILLADEVSRDLATVASRCVEVPFPPVPRPAMVQWLTESGLEPDVAAVVADSSGGSPGRARIMMHDPDVAERLALWTSVPSELTGSGSSAAALARRVLDSAERAVEPLKAEHARQIEQLTAEAEMMGERGLPGRKEIVEQHARVERRWRTDALRAGLGALARVYGGQVVRASAGTVPPGDPTVRAAVEAVSLITETTVALPRNPNEALLLQSLFLRLGSLAA
jgi:DNA polymerase-3 subunit delta'